ncbi:MAG: RsmE family RNA methyltransferase [bacterium]
MSKHVFSIYIEDLSSILSNLNKNDEFDFKDKKTHDRIINTLRLQKDDELIFFNNSINIKIQLLDKTFENNKFIYAQIIEKKESKVLKPEIILCPSLIKKHSLEELVYNAAAMGATIIRPVITEKVQRKWGFEKEKERLEKIIIAACEQSKNYVLPELHGPIKLPMLLNGLENLAGKKIFFESDQKPLMEIIPDIASHKNGKIILFFGPEGGLTNQEVLLLRTKGFEGCSLTETILRSQEAVTVGLGVVRSILR